MAIDGAQLSLDIKQAFEDKMEATVGQPFTDNKASLDDYTTALGEAVGEEVAAVAAADAPYVPAVPGDWAGNPTDANNALDRLAAAVAGLLAAPVP